MKPNDQPKTTRLRWMKPVFWVSIPLIGVLSLLGIALSRQQAQLSSQAPSPSLTASPLQTIAPSPLVTPSQPSQTTKKPTPKPSLKPVDPTALTEQQKAINRQSKAAFGALGSSVDALIEMHVAIAEGQPVVSVGAPTGALLLDQKGQKLHQLPPGSVYSAQPDGSGMRFGEWQLPEVVWLEIPPGRVFQLGNRTYRGRLLLVVNNGKLWAVNYINMRQYLYSVVASEVSPSWKMEALKAQAVAARSYALTYYFKPVSPLFHMGATEYYQVYSGIQREAATTSEAVDATAGEFVSYRGGIVESLYAASDDIVAEAFQGKGMSQLGALALAEQGYSYKQILSNYYPKTGVARIEEDKD
ncbi:SpoIID/LytB domain-containing protein [Stenomitos frigidus]|uniref:SpoIID/LytB domain-containing protein n=1 Tax=Stenomitos frigidus ULC18 TaxID=2107698 RepID=A0A2T1E338_9CYAN|nr:SpoIID/LytB domain-containing protein [Stenomitos frigidus]PSB27145.1 SpoIID/LytB domain-containing protein [Stenomitos frigidus ULC18]